jgi:SAM-dependent methyltransferase
MTQYQSFPDASGASSSLDKLSALRLPPLKGASFLDVGCNEGFFCGYAAFDGASRVLGIDSNKAFIDAARRRFPNCEFQERSWDNLPDGRFDVVLIASAIHYATDQADLIHRLVNILSEDGILVIELGITNSEKNEWSLIKRGIDERYFASWSKMYEILRPYAWKYIGPSPKQSGDPIDRKVIHVSRLRPTAYLMMNPPGTGKSTMARNLFKANGINVVSGDDLINRIASSQLNVHAELKSVISENYSSLTIDKTIERICSSGMLAKFFDSLIGQAGSGDFAFDGYVPSRYHREVMAILSSRGYMPVHMTWERAGVELSTEARAKGLAKAYFQELNTGTRQPKRSGPKVAKGHVDSAVASNNLVEITGWAFDLSETIPQSLVVLIDGVERHVVDLVVVPRPDVQRHFDLSTDQVGFKFVQEFSSANASLQIFGISGDSRFGPFGGLKAIKSSS